MKLELCVNRLRRFKNSSLLEVLPKREKEFLIVLKMTKKVLFMNAPSQDPSDRFFGWPTSLLYAIAPSIDAARRGNLDIEIVPRIFDPINYSRESREAVEKELGRVIEKERVDGKVTWNSSG